MENLRGRQPISYSPGLFSWDECSLPAYRQLGEACLSTDPLDRPSFDEAHEALLAMLQAESGRRTVASSPQLQNEEYSVAGDPSPEQANVRASQAVPTCEHSDPIFDENV